MQENLPSLQNFLTYQKLTPILAYLVEDYF